jgi:hypothetical protein
MIPSMPSSKIALALSYILTSYIRIHCNKLVLNLRGSESTSMEVVQHTPPCQQQHLHSANADDPTSEMADEFGLLSGVARYDVCWLCTVTCFSESSLLFFGVPTSEITIVNTVLISGPLDSSAYYLLCPHS